MFLSLERGVAALVVELKRLKSRVPVPRRFESRVSDDGINQWGGVGGEQAFDEGNTENLCEKIDDGKPVLTPFNDDGKPVLPPFNDVGKPVSGLGSGKSTNVRTFLEGDVRTCLCLLHQAVLRLVDPVRQLVLS